MRQLIVIALLIALAFGAEMPMMQKNCSAIPKPGAAADYYRPPKECVDSDPAIKACVTTFFDCVKAQSNFSCMNVDMCFLQRAVCLIKTNPSSTNCTAWSTGLENAGLYLLAGGNYKESSLERACESAYCGALAEAAMQNVTGAKICAANFSIGCVAPNFEAPTQAPGQPSFSIVFGGAAWADVLSKAAKGSPEYKKLEGAVAKGLAKLLGTLEHLITILDMKIGSLVVDFIVNDPNVSVATITSQILAVKNDPTLAGSTFSELAAVSGVTIEVSGGGQAGTDAPVPSTGTPAPLSSSAVSVVAAIVAIVAMMF